jgi:hypothetical protein
MNSPNSHQVRWTNEWGDPTASYTWTGWVWEVTGSLQKNYRSILRTLQNIPPSNKLKPKDVNVESVGLGNSRILTDYGGKYPGTLRPVYTMAHEVGLWKIAKFHGSTACFNFHGMISWEKLFHKVVGPSLGVNKIWIKRNDHTSKSECVGFILKYMFKKGNFEGIFLI